MDLCPLQAGVQCLQEASLLPSDGDGSASACVAEKGPCKIGKGRTHPWINKGSTRGDDAPGACGSFAASGDPPDSRVRQIQTHTATGCLKVRKMSMHGNGLVRFRNDQCGSGGSFT